MATMTSVERASGRIDLNIDGPLARITLNNPNQRNAMTTAMWQQLAQTLDVVEADSGVRAVVVSGAGERAFCAGANIDELTAAMHDALEMRRQNALIRTVQVKLQQLSRPTLAVIRGACYGGGCGLALACDIRLAEIGASFAITPARLGILYSLVDTRRLVSAVGQANARELLLTGLPVTAERAQQIGLVQRLAETAALAQVESEIATSLVENSQYSLRWTKATLDFLSHSEDFGPEEHDAERALLESAFDDAFSGSDFREGAAAFLARRKAKFRWPEK